MTEPKSESLSQTTTFQQAPPKIVAGSPREARTLKKMLYGFLNSTSIQAKVIAILLSLFIFVGIWQLFADLIGNQVILAPPVTVLEALVLLFQGHVPSGAEGLGNLYTATARTIEIIIYGFALSLLGIPLGIVMGRWKSAEAIIDPWINALYVIPMIAFAPILYFIIGGTYFADVFVSFLLGFFTVVINVYSSVEYISNSIAEIGRTFGATEFQFLRKIVLPASLPDIVAGMRLGLGRCILGALVGEILLTRSDLGDMMIDFQSLLSTQYMMAVVFIVAIIGIVAQQFPKLLEKRLFKWKESERMSRGM
ncbi:MAG: ABC transporter permease [Nitrososphaerota archaeon]|nr:ABC transporter permease [Nitrososphaerota archaeon]